MQQVTHNDNVRHYLRDFYQILNGKRSLAKAAFNRLKPGQQRLLLEASGISKKTSIIYNETSQFEYTSLPVFSELTNSDLDNLQKGLRRLQAIIDVFASCEQQDFKKD